MVGLRGKMYMELRTGLGSINVPEHVMVGIYVEGVSYISEFLIQYGHHNEFGRGLCELNHKTRPSATQIIMTAGFIDFKTLNLQFQSTWNFRT